MVLLAECLILLLWGRILVMSVLAAVFHACHRQDRQHISGREKSHQRLAAIVPAYNEAPTIGPTLQALLAQSRPPDEIIVVDDGSTDETHIQAGAVLDSRPGHHVIRLRNNSGKSIALNTALKQTDADLVVTVDADTELEPDALALAIDHLQSSESTAIALQPVVEPKLGFVAALQAQEYAASLNFERAGQSQIGIISVLPGAATLFNRYALQPHGFSKRTRTEDADLTLTISRQGGIARLAAGCEAVTRPPLTVRALVEQRIRWWTGHLQCVVLHSAVLVGRRPWRARACLTYLNFTLGTLAPLIALIALISVQLGGRTPLLTLDWLAVVGVSLGLSFVQRCLAVAVGAAPYPGLRVFLIEPFFSGSVAVIAPLISLKRFAVGTSPLQAR